MYVLPLLVIVMMSALTTQVAPEQIKGVPYSGEKNDIWSLGIILYTMLYAEPPFKGTFRVCRAYSRARLYDCKVEHPKRCLIKFSTTSTNFRLKRRSQVHLFFFQLIVFFSTLVVHLGLGVLVLLDSR